MTTIGVFSAYGQQAYMESAHYQREPVLVFTVEQRTKNTIADLTKALVHQTGLLKEYAEQLQEEDADSLNRPRIIEDAKKTLRVAHDLNSQAAKFANEGTYLGVKQVFMRPILAKIH